MRKADELMSVNNPLAHNDYYDSIFNFIILINKILILSIKKKSVNRFVRLESHVIYLINYYKKFRNIT